MANSYTGADIINGALRKAGELADGTSPYQELAVKVVNDCYLDLLSASSLFDTDIGEPWPWAKSDFPISLILEAPFDDGSLTLTNGSDAGTFSVAPAVGLGSLVDRFVKVNNVPDFYRIKTHTAGATAFTLDAPYQGDSDSGLAFRAHKLIYNLGTSIARIVEPIQLYRNQAWDDNDMKIFGLDADRFHKEFPLARLQMGLPTRFARMKQSDSVFKIQMNRSVSESVKVDIEYVPYPETITPSVDSIPIIPREKRVFLEYAGAHFLCLDKGLKDQAATWFSHAQNCLRSMLRDNNRKDAEVSKNYGRILPRQDQVGVPRVGLYYEP